MLVGSFNFVLGDQFPYSCIQFSCITQTIHHTNSEMNIHTHTYAYMFVIQTNTHTHTHADKRYFVGYYLVGHFLSTIYILCGLS